MISSKHIKRAIWGIGKEFRQGKNRCKSKDMKPHKVFTQLQVIIYVLRKGEWFLKAGQVTLRGLEGLETVLLKESLIQVSYSKDLQIKQNGIRFNYVCFKSSSLSQLQRVILDISLFVKHFSLYYKINTFFPKYLNTKTY